MHTFFKNASQMAYLPLDTFVISKESPALTSVNVLSLDPRDAICPTVNAKLMAELDLSANGAPGQTDPR